jgi:hypothetical protein
MGYKTESKGLNRRARGVVDAEFVLALLDQSVQNAAFPAKRSNVDGGSRCVLMNRRKIRESARVYGVRRWIEDVFSAVRIPIRVERGAV